MPKSNAPLFPAYSGLQASFRKTAENLCRHSLTHEAWKSWAYVRRRDRTAFPINGSWQDKLSFVDHYLYEILTPQNVAHNVRMRARFRTDLNKYRGWLLHRILLSMLPVTKISSDNIDAQALTETPAMPSPYRLPEDFPNLINDLYIFHKNIKGLDANIARVKDLADLDNLIAVHRPAYPLTSKDRALAHARHIEVTNDTELKSLLPTGWRVKRSFKSLFKERLVLTPAGQVIRNAGGAKLIASLGDGTEIIQLLSWDANLAYGSPRWCTTHEAQYFEKYKKDLTVILASDGRRWQLQNTEQQYRDAVDNPIDLGAFLLQDSPFDFIDKSERKNWNMIMAPFFMAAIRKSIPLNLRQAERLFKIGVTLPLCRTEGREEIPKLLRKASDNDDMRVIECVLNAATLIPEWGIKIAKEALQVHNRVSGIGNPFVRADLKKRIGSSLYLLTGKNL